MRDQVIWLSVFCGIYAVVRYTVFGPVSVENIPIYIANKAVSMASVGAMVFAATAYFRAERGPPGASRARRTGDRW